MFRTSALACLAALCALPAAAQYIDQGFRDAYAIFGNVSPDVTTAPQMMEKLLPALEGRWIPVDILAGGGPTAETIDDPLNDYERFCDAIVYDLTVTSRLGFEMLRHNLQSPDSRALTAHFDYAGFNTYLRSQRTGDYLAYMAMPEDEPIPSQILSGVLSQAIVSVYHPNRDTLVLVNLGGRTEYYGRCP